MLQSIKCTCGHAFTVADAPAGYLVTCPACGQQVPVPSSDPAELGYAAPAQGQTVVTPRAIEMLRRTVLWAKIMAILMFIGDGFFVVAAISMFALSASFPSGDAPPAILGLIYLAMAAVNLPAGIFLLRFARRAKSFVAYRHEQLLEEALDLQRAFWKYTAILSLTIIGIYVVAIAFFVLMVTTHHTVVVR